jgi:hypothetical protein
MFSISTTDFPHLAEFVNKLKASSHEKSDFDAIRDWCSERGYLLHFSKTDVSASSSPNVFYTLKYDRAKLTDEQYSTVGKLRSVVFDRDGHICCVAPPKMLTLSNEMNTQEVNSVGSILSAEELVEGIMVNLFWRGSSGTGSGRWYIATKSCVGEVSFDHIVQAEAEAEAQAAAAAGGADGAPSDDTVREEPREFQKLGVQEILRRRICEVLSLLPGGLTTVPTQYCYSLVIQHPKNQIVNNITVPKLYLVAVYELSYVDTSVGVSAVRIDRDIFSQNFSGSVTHMPSTLTCVSDEIDTEAATATAAVSFTPHTVDDYCKMYASADTRSVSLPGVVFVDKDTGFCYKKRNPKYESVKKRKGMEQKLAAQYLQLRKDRAIDEYLKYHPQHSRAFQQFRERFHEYTQNLYDAYIEHYVKKNAKPLKEYERELKIHMYKLHYDVYLAKMKEAGVFVTKHTVIDYVNQLAPAQQFACVIATPLPVRDALGGGEAAARGHRSSSSFHQNPKKPIERSQPKSDSVDVKNGFRNSRISRGGRMVPSLSIQAPSSTTTDDTAAANGEVDKVKGSKSTGCVKVQNQFAGLDVDE